MERRDRRGTQTSLLARDDRVEMRLRMGLGAKLGKSVQPYTSVVVSTAQHSKARPDQTRRASNAKSQCAQMLGLVQVGQGGRKLHVDSMCGVWSV